jgi:hypothetical protein
VVVPTCGELSQYVAERTLRKSCSGARPLKNAALSVTTKKYQLLAKWRYPVLAR